MKRILILTLRQAQGIPGILPSITVTWSNTSGQTLSAQCTSRPIRGWSDAGAGLESPIVFLVGLRELFEEEQSMRLADDEREDMIRDNTRKIYMAATRAGQRLVFTYVGQMPEVMKQIFKNHNNEG